MRITISFLAFLILASPALAQERLVFGGLDGSGLTAGNFQGIGATSQAVTGSFGAGTNFIRVVCTTACYIAVAATGTQALLATAATGAYLPANLPETFRATQGETIAVITASGSGSLYVHELTR